jgi:hypothetical protein
VLRIHEDLPDGAVAADVAGDVAVGIGVLSLGTDGVGEEGCKGKYGDGSHCRLDAATCQ